MWLTGKKQKPTESSYLAHTYQLITSLFLAASLASAAPTVTEQRSKCQNYAPLKRPLFGDLHVHTSYSFDSYVSSQRNDPWAAYRYAKGQPITLSDADGKQTVTAQIGRPLDFTALTDHAEFLGEMNICTTDPWSLGYWAPLCLLSRSDTFIVQLIGASWWVNLGVADSSKAKERSMVCDFPGEDCEQRLNVFWDNIQQAAEDHYDRSENCSFTTFIGYEYTDAPNYKNLHRNVIFRNERVTASPINTYDTGTNNVPELWRRLRSECIDGDQGCDVLAIPHNANLSGGLMFPDPSTKAEAIDRDFFEPLFEMTQHKSASECRFDRLLGRGVDTEDELCTFEQNKNDTLASLGYLNGKMQSDQGMPVALDDFGRRNMIRNVLKDGLALEQISGINPFKLGFIGSTDTHSATPGGAEEDNYVGHLGRRDSGYRNVQDHFWDNPGGLAVVWAEENSRDAIFESMRNKETYATSGTRPIVRVFGGWDFDPAICDAADLVSQGYANGVPMGGDLGNAPAGTAPIFVVNALKDSGIGQNPGTDLQRIQIIKGWLDSDGRTHEKVFDIAGNANNGASVDPNSCAVIGDGAKQLCAVWKDPEFNSEQRAFYYARILENPSCRWSTMQCQAAGVNPFANDCQTQAEKMNKKYREGSAIGDVFGKCCLAEKDEPYYSPTIQERAWTSPIWYNPGSHRLIR
ncbi:DUF3604 domain-containing protein [Oceanicoccus sp. KOV_DT_Chl]|uniref:DUF3604 domain-containing protein n=1 Tax=Oceanicoccus sp. KOV_DT_Chl TaxID=1904639 RepID=UPI000C7D97FA|nr:DUF3604 domain-containing protein [Oceanicoccus sp. KOV_DT_Chl]